MASVAAPNRQVHLDTAVYPRTYTTSGGYRIVLLVMSSIAIGAGLLGTWYFATGHEMKSPSEPYVFSLVSICFFLLGAYLAVATIKSKIVLTTNAIDVHGIFITKQLLRSELVGWRIVPTQYFSTLVLVHRDPSVRKIKIALTMNADKFFLDWLSAAPNLDEAESEEFRAQLDANLEIGVTHEQRSERIATAQILASRLGWVAWAVTAWSWFYPRPYWLVALLLAGLPIVAVLIGLRSIGLYNFEGRRNDLRPSLAIPVIIPGAGLALLGISELHFLRWQDLIPMVTVFCLTITGLISVADPVLRQRRWPVLGILLIAFMDGSGAVAHADALLDRSSPRGFISRVVRKRVSTGRSTSYRLTISPWGPQSDFTDVRVSARDYNAVQSGDPVCILLFPGALRISWYLVEPCPLQRPAE
jgi:hypothetical protein